jgi:hypothetical protein
VYVRDTSPVTTNGQKKDPVRFSPHGVFVFGPGCYVLTAFPGTPGGRGGRVPLRLYWVATRRRYVTNRRFKASQAHASL